MPVIEQFQKDKIRSYPHHIFDVNGATRELFVKDYSQYDSINVCRSVKELASQSEVVISSLPLTKIVQNVYLNDDDVIAVTPSPDRLMI